MVPIIVKKGRTNIIPVSLGKDVSSDAFSSQIRTEKSSSSDLIASWTVSFDTDGTDGELLLTLDNSVTTGISCSVGYMDLKRISAGEPYDVFDEPLEVHFKETVTS